MLAGWCGGGVLRGSGGCKLTILSGEGFVAGNTAVEGHEFWPNSDLDLVMGMLGGEKQ